MVAFPGWSEPPVPFSCFDVRLDLVEQASALPEALLVALARLDQGVADPGPPVRIPSKMMPLWPPW